MLSAGVAFGQQLLLIPAPNRQLLGRDGRASRWRGIRSSPNDRRADRINPLSL